MEGFVGQDFLIISLLDTLLSDRDMDTQINNCHKDSLV